MKKVSNEFKETTDNIQDFDTYNDPIDPIVIKDLVNNIFDEVTQDDKVKASDEEAEPFDEKVERLKLDSEAIHSFTKNIDDLVSLRKKYAYWLIAIFILQLILFNIIFILIGCGILQYSERSLNIFISGSVIEIISLITIVTKHLFSDQLSQSLKDILEKNKVNKN